MTTATHAPWRRHWRTGALAAALLACTPTAMAAVFINELHYDNVGVDVGEAVEIVATGGESLTGYSLVLYNGPRVYGTVAVPAGQMRDCGAPVRIAHIPFPRNGLQNGPADGLALVDALGAVVQFISYEGAIHATHGPAAGLHSTEIPVSEGNATPVGTSLQLQGSGFEADDFTWATGIGQTFGQCNAGQTFGGGSQPGVPPVVTATTPVDGTQDFPAAGDLDITFDRPVSAAPGAFRLDCDVSGDVSLQYPASGTAFTLNTDTALHGGETCTLSMDAAAVNDGDGLSPAADLAVHFAIAGSGPAPSGYYSAVNTSSPAQLRCSLHATIAGHTAYRYSGSGTNTWTILELADAHPDDDERILDAYRNRSYARGSDRAGTGRGLTYNREHTWPKSLGFPSATGDRGLPHAPHTDAHMLYLTDADHNARRGNKPLADCSPASQCADLATEANAGQGGPGQSNRVRGPDGNGGSFEVWSQRRGDIARAVMYMAIRYEGGRHPQTGQSEPDLELTDDRSLIVSTSASPAYMGLLSTLLAWHAADPPDARERARNDVVYSFQGNRNPFIDHPEWATRALFESTPPAQCQPLH